MRSAGVSFTHLPLEVCSVNITEKNFPRRWPGRCETLGNMSRTQWRSLLQSGSQAEGGSSLSLLLLSSVQPWTSEVEFKGKGAHVGPSFILYFKMDFHRKLSLQCVLAEKDFCVVFLFPKDVLKVTIKLVVER